MQQHEALQVYLYQLVHKERHGLFAMLLLAILRLMSVIYGVGVALKLTLYRYGILKQHRLPCKVISLGNITVGGTGKTPTAERLAAEIRDLGYKVVILNRGYRAGLKQEIGLVSDGQKIYMTAAEAGDEAYLLAKNLPGVPVVIGKQRVLTGDFAVKELHAEVIILDDGYQHWQLARDLDIVLIDTINVFGNNCLLPRGTLREPLSSLSRADAFLLTKVDQSSHDTRDEIRNIVEQYNKRALVVESIHQPCYFVEIVDWYKGAQSNFVELDALKGQKVFAFSAIGNPSSFEQTLLDIGAEVVETARFPDHHDYTMVEMQNIMQKAVDSRVAALVTTEKDAVKIPSEFIHSDRPLKVYVLEIKVKFLDGCQELMAKVKQVANH